LDGLEPVAETVYAVVQLFSFISYVVYMLSQEDFCMILDHAVVDHGV